MAKFKKSLKSVKNFVFGLDGTLWRWSELIKDAKTTVDKLRNEGKKVYIVTNNSLLTRKGLATRLQKLGLKIKPGSILTSGHVTAQLLSDKGVSKAYVLGEQGLVDELTAKDIKISDSCKDIVVSLDRNMNYWKLAKAAKLINKGANFWSTGTAPVLDVGKRKIPGEGAYIEALKTITGQEPQLLGKPSDYMKNAISDEFGLYPEKTIMIGDSLRSDIVLGNKLGLRTGLVLGGESKKEDLRNANGIEVPNFVFQDIKRILRKV